MGVLALLHLASRLFLYGAELNALVIEERLLETRQQTRRRDVRAARVARSSRDAGLAVASSGRCERGLPVHRHHARSTETDVVL